MTVKFCQNGTKMNLIPLVDLKTQYEQIESEIDYAIKRVLSNAHFVKGEDVNEFEEDFAIFQKTKYSVSVASGTSAILLALRAIGVGPGDEVIAPAHTYIATIEPIELLGAKTVLVDVDPLTYNMDPEKLERVITSATKAIIPVHMYGQMAQMDKIAEIAKKYKLAIVEDAAQSHGAEYKGLRAGNWGDIACFSFYPSKNLGCYGDGGAICTNDKTLANRVRLLRDHGRKTKYASEEIGYCERLDTIQAAILKVKIRYLETWNEKRRQCASYYNSLFQACNKLITPLELSVAHHVYHIYAIRVRYGRNKLIEDLKRAGIEVGIHYPLPVYLQPAMARYKFSKGDFPEAESISNTELSLPLYPELTSAQQDYIVDQFLNSLENITSVKYV